MKRREPVRFSRIMFSPISLLLVPILAAAQEKIAFTSSRDGDNEIYIMNPDGTFPTRLTNLLTNNNGQPSFSFDGRKIVFASGLGTVLPGIYVMNLDGSGQTLATLDGAQPSFSPDGSRIVFSSGRDGNSEIYIMNADGSDQTRLTNTPDGDELGPTFSPDGTRILFTELHDFELQNFTDEIYVMKVDGSDRVPLTNDMDPAAYSRQARFSPDGSKIVFTHFPELDSGEIYIMNADGSGQTPLTNNAVSDSTPTFSPDGSKIAFRSTRDGPAGDIYVMNADGTGVVRVTFGAAFDGEPSWADTNIRPTITAAAGVTRVRNAGPSNSLIATVDDVEDPPGTLDVTVNGGASATVNGVTISNIFVDAPGNVSADITAVTPPCGSTLAAFTLRVTDSGGRFSQAILVVSTTPVPAPGALPGNAFAGVVPGPDARLYGVTYNCGTTNNGTIYVYNPTSQAVTELHDFNGSVDGSVPYDDLVFDTVSGKFYGTTSNGGPSGLGTVFTFDPVTHIVTTIRSDFGGYREPIGAPVRSNGYLYGTVDRTGAIYRMAPDGSNFAIIHAFTQFSTQPQPLTLGWDGMLYGVTLRGGILCPAGSQLGCGTVFRLKPVLPGDLDEQFQTIHQFQGPGFRFVNPFRHMIYSTDGYLYGATLYSVFRVDPDDGANLQFIFASSGFNGGNGFPMIAGADDRLYLTDYFGGPEGAGSVFSINKDGTGLPTTLLTFNYDTGSNGPYGRLSRNAAGTIFGTTEYDAAGGPGTVFVITQEQIFGNGFEN